MAAKDPISLRATGLKSNEVVVLYLVSMTSKTILLLSSQNPDFCLFRGMWSWKRRGPGIVSHERMAHFLLPRPPEKSQWNTGFMWCSDGEELVWGTFSGHSLLRLLQVAQHIPSLWEIWEDEKCRTITEFTPPLAGLFSSLVEEKEVKFHA